MFKRLSDKPEITITFDGDSISACVGDTVAAAILNSGRTSIRQSTVSHHHRGPYCLMGACYECLVRYEGKTVQACMLRVQADMVIERVVPPDTITDNSGSGDD